MNDEVQSLKSELGPRETLKAVAFYSLLLDGSTRTPSVLRPTFSANNDNNMTVVTCTYHCLSPCF